MLPLCSAVKKYAVLLFRDRSLEEVVARQRDISLSLSLKICSEVIYLIFTFILYTPTIKINLTFCTEANSFVGSFAIPTTF